MRRSVAVLVAGLLLGGLAIQPALAQQIKPVGPGTVDLTTKTGIDFKFGISIDFQPMSVHNLDFNKKTNFKTITEFGAIGEEDSIIGFENRLYFTATKDLLSIYTAIELDGTLDEREADANNPNIERLNISLLVPPVNTTFSVGFDIYALDPIGGLVYIDDDPGVWFKGGVGPWSWQAGWHKRTECGGAAGDSERRFPCRAKGIFDKREDDTNILTGKIGYDFQHPAGRFHISPFALVYLRDTPNTGSGLTRLNLVGPGGVTRPATDPLQASIADIVPSQTTSYIGIEGTGNIGWLRPSAEFVYLTGDISGLIDRKTGKLPFGFESFDIRSWAWYARLDFDWSKEPWWPLRGIIPFVSAEMLRGDDNPFDNTLHGFVSPSTPNALRRGDFPLLRKTVLGLGSPILGDGTADFGFATDGRGTGPTIGNINEGATFGGSSLFNNRFGKGDNPGYVKISGGLQGSWDKQWELHLIGNYLRFHKTEPIEAEFRSLNIGSVDKSIGGGIDVVVVYKPQPQYKIQPFISVFFPGSGAKQIAGGDDTAIIGGVDFFAMF